MAYAQNADEFDLLNLDFSAAACGMDATSLAEPSPPLNLRWLLVAHRDHKGGGEPLALEEVEAPEAGAFWLVVGMLQRQREAAHVALHRWVPRDRWKPDLRAEAAVKMPTRCIRSSAHERDQCHEVAQAVGAEVAIVIRNIVVPVCEDSFAPHEVAERVDEEAVKAARSLISIPGSGIGALAAMSAVGAVSAGVAVPVAVLVGAAVGFVCGLMARPKAIDLKAAQTLRYELRDARMKELVAQGSASGSGPCNRLIVANSDEHLEPVLIPEVYGASARPSQIVLLSGTRFHHAGRGHLKVMVPVG